jgi:hypothetical protein
MKTEAGRQWSRRRFLGIGGGVVALFLAGDPLEAARALGGRWKRGPVMYRLSLRGRRGSRAAKKHNANLRFATARAADQNRAFVGDNSRIVAVPVSLEEYIGLFVRRRSLVADLRDL